MFSSYLTFKECQNEKYNKKFCFGKITLLFFFENTRFTNPETNSFLLRLSSSINDHMYFMAFAVIWKNYKVSWSTKISQVSSQILLQDKYCSYMCKHQKRFFPKESFNQNAKKEWPISSFIDQDKILKDWCHRAGEKRVQPLFL